MPSIPLRIYAQCNAGCARPTTHDLNPDSSYYCTTCADHAIPASAAIAPEDVPADHAHLQGAAGCQHPFDFISNLDECRCQPGMAADPELSQCPCHQCYVRRVVQNPHCPACGTNLDHHTCPPSCRLAHLTEQRTQPC